MSWGARYASFDDFSEGIGSPSLTGEAAAQLQAARSAASALIHSEAFGDDAKDYMIELHGHVGQNIGISIGVKSPAVGVGHRQDEVGSGSREDDAPVGQVADELLAAADVDDLPADPNTTESPEFGGGGGFAGGGASRDFDAPSSDSDQGSTEAPASIDSSSDSSGDSGSSSGDGG